MQKDPTLDHSGFFQVNKEAFTTTRPTTVYAELHGFLLYYWTEKPKTNGALPIAVIDLAGARLYHPEDARLDIVIQGPDHTKIATLSFSADRERNEWLAKMESPVKAHSKKIEIQKPQAAHTEEADNGGQTTIFTSEGQHKKISIDDFILIRVLGEGAFGRVMQVAKKDTGKQYAMKVMNRKRMEESSGGNTPIERAILAEVHHPFIVQLHYAFQTRESLFIVMDLLAGGELFFHLEHEGFFSEDRAKFYTAEIGLAIGYLHSKKIIYRDLKPENVVLDAEGHACLTDFGLAKANIGINPTANTFCGTPEYQAPEFLLGNPHGRAVDWWSLGIMLYEMLFGIPPFYDENVSMMSELIIEGNLTFDKNARSASPDAESLIRRLLDGDPSKRMQTLEEFKAHPFFADIDFDKLCKRQLTPPFTPDPNAGNNFDEEFTCQGITIDESSTDGNVHGHLANFTYVRDESDNTGATTAVSGTQSSATPPPASASNKPASLVKAGSGNSGSNHREPVGPPSKQSSTVKSNSSSSSPKLKPSSPTTKRSGGGTTPPPHLVAKAPIKRPTGN